MTSGGFQYIDLDTVKPGEKPWNKVDGPGWSFKLKPHPKPVTNLRENPDLSKFTTDNAGFSIHQAPSKVTAADFDNDQAVRTAYYDEVASVLRQHLPAGDKVSHIEIFDHTIRKHNPLSPRQPVQQVHVDQTPRAAATRVRRHLPADQAEKFLQGRYQIINVWRPISHPASDFPLAVIDWRTTAPEDFIKVDLMYPKRSTTTTTTTTTANDSSTSSSPSANSSSNTSSDDDDRGKEALPDPSSHSSTEGYEPRGETLTVAPNDSHQFFYVKDMTPDETMFIKCFDSRSEWINDEGYVSGTEGKAQAQAFGGFGKGKRGVAMGTPHTAFVDPLTPEGVKGRESIEVRCLVFYDD